MFKYRKRKTYHSDKQHCFIPIIADYSDTCYNRNDEIRRYLSDGKSGCGKMEYLRAKNPGLVFTMDLLLPADYLLFQLAVVLQHIIQKLCVSPF